MGRIGPGEAEHLEEGSVLGDQMGLLAVVAEVERAHLDDLAAGHQRPLLGDATLEDLTGQLHDHVSEGRGEGLADGRGRRVVDVGGRAATFVVGDDLEGAPPANLDRTDDGAADR